MFWLVTKEEIAQIVRTKMAEFRRACEGLNEESSFIVPEGRWSPKHIVSHLWGQEGTGYLPGLKAFIEKDIPLLDVKPDDPFWSEGRSRLTLSELLSEFDREYSGIAAFVEVLSEEQFSRRAHIPMLKESPLGEYPTRVQWVLALFNYHIENHINFMREIMQAVGLRVRS